MNDPCEFRARICLDLKKFDLAALELSKGSPKQKEESLELIKKHKLYKQGLKIYSGKEELNKVKEFIIEELLNTGEVNEAYRVCQSTGNHQRCL